MEWPFVGEHQPGDEIVHDALQAETDTNAKCSGDEPELVEVDTGRREGKINAETDDDVPQRHGDGFGDAPRYPRAFDVIVGEDHFNHPGQCKRNRENDDERNEAAEGKINFSQRPCDIHKASYPHEDRFVNIENPQSDKYPEKKPGNLDERLDALHDKALILDDELIGLGLIFFGEKDQQAGENGNDNPRKYCKDQRADHCTEELERKLDTSDDVAEDGTGDDDDINRNGEFSKFVQPFPGFAGYFAFEFFGLRKKIKRQER